MCGWSTTTQNFFRVFINCVSSLAQPLPSSIGKKKAADAAEVREAANDLLELVADVKAVALLAFAEGEDVESNDHDSLLSVELIRALFDVAR